MTVVYTIVHEKPSVDIEWSTVSEDMDNRINFFKERGDIISFDTVQNSELKSTTTIVFKDETSENIVVTDSQYLDFANAIMSLYDSRGITYTLDRTVE